MRSKCVGFLAAIMSFLCAPTFGQDSASFTKTVRDSSGAVFPNPNVVGAMPVASAFLVWLVPEGGMLFRV
jgi:hypothetical protein